MKILAGILALSAAAFAGIWLFPDVMDQDRVLASGGTAMGTAALLVLWLLFLSPIRWKMRFLSVGALALAIGVGASCFRIVGVTGNLVPILGWRWSRAEPHAGEPAAAARELAVSAIRLEPVDPLDYPRFLGPAGNATIEGVHLDTNWAARAPRTVWRRPMGAGWSSFAIAAGHAVTQEQRGEEELVSCYNLATGDPEWVHADRARFDEVIGGEGPRATPTISGGRVYAVGATGRLHCLDGATGKAIWSHEFVKENGGHVNHWGKSCSPLVFENKVVVSAGGGKDRSIVAYDALSGEIAWSGGGEASGYGSPALATLAGEPQILIFNHGSLTAHDPGDGKVLWTHPWQNEHPNVTQPAICRGGRVLLSTGYGIGCELIEVRNPEGKPIPIPLWKSTSLKSKLSNVVTRGAFAYGLDDGILACIDLADGRRAWKKGRYGHGQLLLVEDVIIVQAESGELALVTAKPEGHEELARIPALNDKTWNHAAFRPPYLLVRNHKEAICFELPLAK